MSRELRVGLVGYGYMGRVHSLGYVTMPFHYRLPVKVRLVGVASRSRENRDLALREAGFQWATQDYEELVGSPEIDIVHCCTPTYLHKEVLLKAIGAGKPVYVEKPAGTSAGDVRSAQRAAQSNGCPCQVAYQNRFSSAAQRARALIREGAIGEVVNFRLNYFGSEYIAVDRVLGWQVKKETAGGGALMSQGCHGFDLLRFLTGDEVRRVFARLRSKMGQAGAEPEVETMAHILLEMKGGATGTLEVSQVAAGSNIDLRYEVYGTRGTIRFDQAYPDFLQVFRQDEEATPHGGFRGFTAIQTLQKYEKQVFPPWRVGTNWLRYSMESQYRFIMAILEGREPEPSLVDALRAYEAIEACYESGASGGWVQCP